MRGFAHPWRLPAKVIAVQFNQVEAEEEHRAVMAPIPDAIEAWHAIVVAGHRLSMMQERERSRAKDSTISGKR
jgi:hypothetical protein